jgi:hypothetical protein
MYKVISCDKDPKEIEKTLNDFSSHYSLVKILDGNSILLIFESKSQLQSNVHIMDDEGRNAFIEDWCK